MDVSKHSNPIDLGHLHSNCYINEYLLMLFREHVYSYIHLLSTIININYFSLVEPPS